AKKTSDLTADQLSFRLPEPKYRDEYGVLARNFNALFVRLEKSFIQLRHFAVSASHEMRTPLSVIISQTENALRNAEKNGHQSHLNKILQSAIRLRNIMNQLFVLAEADRLGQENAGSSFEVKETIESALGDLKAVYLDMNKTLSVTHIPEQREFIGNQELFVSVFNNLLENALKYSKSRVEISYAVKSSGLEVCIEDDGPGIPETQRESVFQPFFRGKKSESVVPTSHGLGLTIVQACVRAQQGSIELGESVLGGLSVSVKLPHLSPAR
ncbi:sensor histidine kinase, partial [bacterium]|nr:sensor histidine kinase [bacterium]